MSETDRPKVSASSKIKAFYDNSRVGIILALFVLIVSILLKIETFHNLIQRWVGVYVPIWCILIFLAELTLVTALVEQLKRRKKPGAIRIVGQSEMQPELAFAKKSLARYGIWALLIFSMPSKIKIRFL